MSAFDLKKLFETNSGARVYGEFMRAVEDFQLRERFEKGVVVGFSGGSDSVTLLLALKRFSQENKCGKICAVHVNHMIRGAEADRDEQFSREFCEGLGIEFLSFHRDVPTYAREQALGIEEAARNIRYSVFEDLIRGREDLSCVAVAHNATDNLETVIFNMMRGSGTRGISGINPTRDDIIRPLLYVAKRDILRALDDSRIPFVTDSTNLETDYSRNYIRAEILPKLLRLSENPEAAATKLSRALRDDAEYLDGEAERVFSEHKDGSATREELVSMPQAIFYRLVSLMAKSAGCSLESTHVYAIKSSLMNTAGDFSISLPSGFDFVCQCDKCEISKRKEKSEIKYEYKLSMGVNHIEEIDAEIILSDNPVEDFSSKVYKISIQRAIDFDIINGGLYVREKRDGDAYCYGGMTHKLKKLFNDKKIPLGERALIPVICDDNGILWVPGFGIRSTDKEKTSRKLYIAIAKRAYHED